MSAPYASRVLELLRQHRYPGAEHFTERDIGIFAQNPTVKAVLLKFAELHPSLFLTKEQVDVLRLAGELGDPGFLPLCPAEIRKETAELRKVEREQERLSMQERHRQEELNHTEKVIRLLEEDESLRDSVRRKREHMSRVLEVQTKKAEASLKTTQQDLQASSSMFKVEVQQSFRDMKLAVEKVKRPGGLRSLLETESYIAVANGIVDCVEIAHSIISQTGTSPHKQALQVGEKRVGLIKVLEHTAEELDSSCEAILASLRLLCQNSFMYAKLTETLETYKTHLKNSIYALINHLFDSAETINKGQQKKLLPLLRQLEVVVFAYESILLEENRFLQETLDMIRGVHEWKQVLLPPTNDPSNASMFRTGMHANTMMSNEVTFLPSPGLSSTMFEHHSQPQSSMNSTFCNKSTLSAIGNTKALYPSRYFEDFIDTISRDCALLQRIMDQIQSDRSVLCGTSGIQFLSESDRSQLMALAQRTRSKKEDLKKLLRTHEALLRDARNQNQAHYKRLLIPLYILDRQRYEETLKSIRFVVNIFE